MGCVLWLSVTSTVIILLFKADVPGKKFSITIENVRLAFVDRNFVVDNQAEYRKKYLLVCLEREGYDVRFNALHSAISQE